MAKQTKEERLQRLQIANHRRFVALEVIESIKIGGPERGAAVIAAPPVAADHLKVGKVIRAIPGYGGSKAARVITKLQAVLRSSHITTETRLRDMDEADRRRLAHIIRHETWRAS